MEGSVVRRLRDPRCRYTARAMVTVQLKSAGVPMHFRPHRHSRPVYSRIVKWKYRRGGVFRFSSKLAPFSSFTSPFFSSGKSIHRETSTFPRNLYKRSNRTFPLLLNSSRIGLSTLVYNYHFIYIYICFHRSFKSQYLHAVSQVWWIGSRRIQFWYA